MKREILFRGKTKTGNWHFGSLIISNVETCYIRDWQDDGYYEEEVIPETVGQFTGLFDKNGKKIFEGDRVECIKNEKKVGEIDSIEFKDGIFMLCRRLISLYKWIYEMENGDYDFKVIGSIHDTPELPIDKQ